MPEILFGTGNARILVDIKIHHEMEPLPKKKGNFQCNRYFFVNFFNPRCHPPFKYASTIKRLPCSELASGVIKRHPRLFRIEPIFVERRSIYICLSIFAENIPSWTTTGRAFPTDFTSISNQF
jgi:hypothetical protein